MKAHKFFGSFLVLTLLVTLAGAVVASASSGLFSPTMVAHQALDRGVESYDGEGWGIPTTNIAQAATGPIVIDHTCTDISKIPDYWLEETKKLTFWNG
jgi:hypothetical protein